MRPPTPQQWDTLARWTGEALVRMPYLASLVFSLRVVDAPGLGTFAVDAGHRLYIDFDAVAKWSVSQGGQALLHEASHLFAEHAELAKTLRVTSELARISNVAADASINDDLRDAGCEMFADDGGFVLPSTIGAPDFQTYPFYFRHLMSRRRTPNRPGGRQSAAQGAPDGPAGPEAGSGTQNSPNAAPGAPEGAEKPYSGCGSGAGGPRAPHELPETDDLGGTAPAITPTQRERVLIATATSIEQYAKSRGTVPGGLLEQAALHLSPPQIPWQQVLGRAVRSAIRKGAGSHDETMDRRDRRRHNERVITPGGPGRRVVVLGREDRIPRLWVVRDTSGSMSTDDLSAATSEIVGIARRLGIDGENLIVVDVDAQAAPERRFTGARALNEIAGRGGTDMTVGIEAGWKARPTPDAIVVLTDGYTPWPARQEKRIPVVAAIIREDFSTDGIPAWMKAVHVRPGAGN